MGNKFRAKIVAQIHKKIDIGVAQQTAAGKIITAQQVLAAKGQYTTQTFARKKPMITKQLLAVAAVAVGLPQVAAVLQKSIVVDKKNIGIQNNIEKAKEETRTNTNKQISYTAATGASGMSSCAGLESGNEFMFYIFITLLITGFLYARLFKKAV